MTLLLTIGDGCVKSDKNVTLYQYVIYQLSQLVRSFPARLLRLGGLLI